MRARSLLLSCEHGGNRIPKAFAHLFAKQQATLHSHRGLDIGALQMARMLARHLRLPLHAQTISRLLIEANRSLHHPALFSEFSQPLDDSDKAYLVRRVYLPYRRGVQESIAAAAAGVLHISVHSFTPRLHGCTRKTDVGLLYDPGRTSEKALAQAMQRALKTYMPDLKVRCNDPYRGTSDGFTTALRCHFTARKYAGMEIEVNQKHFGTAQWNRIAKALCAVLGAFG